MRIPAFSKNGTMRSHTRGAIDSPRVNRQAQGSADAASIRNRHDSDRDRVIERYGRIRTRERSRLPSHPSSKPDVGETILVHARGQRNYTVARSFDNRAGWIDPSRALMEGNSPERPCGKFGGNRFRVDGGHSPGSETAAAMSKCRSESGNSPPVRFGRSVERSRRYRAAARGRPNHRRSEY